VIRVIKSDLKYVDIFRKVMMTTEPLFDLLGFFQPVVGKYYYPVGAHLGVGTWTDTPANNLHARQYLVFRKCRFDRIGIHVMGAGATGARIRLGIYDDEDFYPKNLILDAGEVVAETVGLKELTINLVLEVGRYWVVGLSNDGTIDWGRDGGHPGDLANLMISPDLNIFARYTISYAYGSLPSTFPTGASLIKGETNVHRIGLRVAEIF